MHRPGFFGAQISLLIALLVAVGLALHLGLRAEHPAEPQSDLTIRFHKGWRGPSSDSAIPMLIAQDTAQHPAGTTCYLYAKSLTTSDATAVILGRASTNGQRWLFRWTADAEYETKPPASHPLPICPSNAELLSDQKNLARLNEVAASQISSEMEAEQKLAKQQAAREAILREAESARQSQKR